MNFQVAPLISVLLALQFAAFGWRINREITIEPAQRWLPPTDILNILSMFAVIWFAVVVPLKDSQFSNASKIVLVVGYILIAFHPVSMAAHYRLFTRARGASSWCTGQELLSVITSLVVATIAGCYLWH